MLEYIVGFTPEYRLAETPREAFPDLARANRGPSFLLIWHLAA